ncbi:MAG: YceD family protein [Curvibacter sp.]
MSQDFHARRLDVRAFAQAGATLEGKDLLSKYERLLAEAGGQGADRPVHWTARGELQADASGQGRVWLHLQADVSLPLTCQRCLGPADIALHVDRAFRFVATEAQAESEDEASEEDVLVLSRDFDLAGLVEDELLMELPLVPRHETCPTEVKLAVQDADFEAAQAAKPQPFAALAGLKGGKSG